MKINIGFFERLKSVRNFVKIALLLSFFVTSGITNVVAQLNSSHGSLHGSSRIDSPRSAQLLPTERNMSEISRKGTQNVLNSSDAQIHQPSNNTDQTILLKSNVNAINFSTKIAKANTGASKSSVLVLAAAADAVYATDIVNKLVAVDLFDKIDYINIITTTPTLAQLQAYNAVLVFTDDNALNPLALGNVLADYIDAGGGVVSAVFYVSGISLSGKFLTDYVLIKSGTSGIGTATLGTVIQPTHAIMQGVVNFNGGSSSYRVSNPTITTGAVVAAQWSDGSPLIVYKTNVGPHNVNRVDLNFYPPSSDARSDFWDKTTDGLRIITNALQFVANTIDVTPTITSLSENSGVVGASVTITGTNFSTTIADNEVYVGSVKAIITAATATTLTFTIPTGAVTGKVKVVLNNGEESLSANDLVILGPPAITSTAITTAPYGQLYNYSVAATTEGNLTTTITAPTKPAWLTLISGGSGVPKSIGNLPSGTSFFGSTLDSDGNTYVITFNGQIIYKITPDGTTTVWRSGLINALVYELYISNGYLYIPRYQSTALSITRIPLNNPSAQEEHFASLTSGALALTSRDGWIYASDYSASEIVRINETTKGKETILTSANDVPSLGTFGLSFDNAGNLYFATYLNQSIMKYNGSRLNTVLSGLPSSVTSVKVDKQGNFYVAMENSGLRKYKPDFSTFELVSASATDNVWGLSLSEMGAVSYTIPNVEVFQINSGAQLNGTPAKTDVGPHNVVLRATNDAGYTEQTFTINVVDNVAPVVSAFSPLTNATGVALKPTLSITFDEEVSLGTSGVFSIYNGTSLVKSYDLSVPADKALFALSTNKLTLSVTLPEDLPVNTVLSVGISAGFVKDIYDNNFIGFAASSNTWKFTTMNKNTQTITFPAISAKTYGQAAFTLGNATTDRGLTVTYTAQDPTVVSIVGNQATIIKAGETKITATQIGDNSNFAATAVERTLTVNKAPLTIAAANKTKIYDGQVYSGFTVTYDGFVKNETVAALTGTLAFEGNAVTAVNFGTNYIITPKGYASNNYNITYVNGILAISKHAVDVTAVSDAKTYDATTASTASPLVGALASGDVIDVAPLQVFSSKNYGDEHVLISTGLRIKNSNNVDVTNNYTISYLNSPATGRILKKQLTVANAIAQSKVYDGNAVAQITGASLVGVVATDDVVIGNAAQGTFAKATVDNDIAVSTNMTISGTAAGNYTIAQPAELKANITAKQLTVANAIAQSKVYDGNAVAQITGVTLVGVVGSDDVVIGNEAQGTFAKATVDNDIAVSTNITISGAAVSNYTIAQPANLKANITAKQLTVANAIAQSKVYDGNTVAQIAGATFVGVVETDDVVIGNATQGTFAKASVDNDIAVSTNMTISGTAAGNYTIAQPADLKANITAKQLTVANAIAQSKVYDGNAVAQITGATLVGVVATDDVVIGNEAQGTFAKATVDNDIAVSTNMTISGTAAGNYTIAQPAELKANITAKQLTVANAIAQSKVYDGNAVAQITGATLVGVVGSDNVVIRNATQGTFAQSNIGTDVAVSSAISISGTAASNYTIAQPTGLKANITAKQLTVANAIAQSKVYDGNAVAQITGATLVGVVGSDDVVIENATQGTFAKTTVDNDIAVSTIMSISGSAAGNYTIAQPADLKANITAKQLTVANAVAQSKVYDGNAVAQITGASLVGVVGTDDVVIGNATQGAFAKATVDNDIAISTAITISGAAASNYTIAQPADLKANITPIYLTASTPILTISKVYDGNASAAVTVGNLSGVLLKDIDNVTLWANANYNNANVGNGKTITVSYYLNGLAANNYVAPTDFVITNDNVVITAKQLTISNPVVVTNKMVDGNTNAAITAVSYLYGVENADAGNVAVHAVANYDNALVGAGKTITVHYTLSGSANSNYITPAPFVINNAVISDYITLSPLANPTAGCEGGEMELSYKIITGDATHYRLRFNSAAISAGIPNVEYSMLPSTTNEGLIRFAIPAGVKEGSYMGVLTMVGDLGIASIDYAFEFDVNLSADMLVTKFDKVIFIDNSSNRFVSYQWYKNNMEIEGANMQYYNDPSGLKGAYSVKVTTTDGKTLYSCQKVLDVVSPRSISAYPNPMKEDQECKVHLTGFDNHDFENAQLTIRNMQGIVVYQTTQVMPVNSVSFNAMPGVYVGHFTAADGANYNFKIVVE